MRVVFPDLPRPSRWPVTWRSMRRGRATTEQLKGLRPRSRIETKRKLKTKNVEESEAIVLDKLWIPLTFGSRLVVLSCVYLDNFISLGESCRIYQSWPVTHCRVLPSDCIYIQLFRNLPPEQRRSIMPSNSEKRIVLSGFIWSFYCMYLWK